MEKKTECEILNFHIPLKQKNTPKHTVQGAKLVYYCLELAVLFIYNCAFNNLVNKFHTCL